MQKKTAYKGGKRGSAKGAAAGGAGAKLAATNEKGEEVLTTTQTSSSNASVEITPQRSRSEAPTDNSIGNVLYQVHRKLMNRNRKMSPQKLLAKQQERQQRAEDLRAKIELSRKEWCIKVRQRQQQARAKFQETVERKRLSLQDRLEQAARNREEELQNVVEKKNAPPVEERSHGGTDTSLSSSSTSSSTLDWNLVMVDRSVDLRFLRYSSNLLL